MSAAVAWTVPVFLERTFSCLHAQAADSLIQTATGKDAPILVVLQLAGGNDGLNTVVPFADDAYYAARPRLAIKPSDILALNDYCGFNGTLAPLKELYDDGHLALIQGVGYPNPNRSHFRSTEIWHTAVDSDRTLSSGWIGRYFDNACRGCDPTAAISIGNETPLALVGKNPNSISFSQTEQFKWKTDRDADKDEFFVVLNAPDEQEAVSGATIGSLGSSRPAGDTMDLSSVRLLPLFSRLRGSKRLRAHKKMLSLTQRVGWPSRQVSLRA